MRLASGNLAISDLAVANTMAATQQFEAQNGLRIFGKTGNAWAIDSAANPIDEQHGWFVGWLQHDGARVVYVHLIVEDGDGAGFASSRARKNVLKNIVGWLSEEDS
jgi:beta-lactamase class D